MATWQPVIPALFISPAATCSPVCSADYTFTTADAGVHAFQVVFYEAAQQNITVADTNTLAIAGTANGLLVVPAAAYQISISYSTLEQVGVPFTLTANIEDMYGNVISNFAGTLHFASTDPAATLPADYTMTASDNGSYSFQATFATPGAQTLTVSDAAGILDWHEYAIYGLGPRKLDWDLIKSSCSARGLSIEPRPQPLKMKNVRRRWLGRAPAVAVSTVLKPPARSPRSQRAGTSPSANSNSGSSGNCPRPSRQLRSRLAALPLQSAMRFLLVGRTLCAECAPSLVSAIHARVRQRRARLLGPLGQAAVGSVPG